MSWQADAIRGGSGLTGTANFGGEGHYRGTEFICRAEVRRQGSGSVPQAAHRSGVVCGFLAHLRTMGNGVAQRSASLAGKNQGVAPERKGIDTVRHLDFEKNLPFWGGDDTRGVWGSNRK